MDKTKYYTVIEAATVMHMDHQLLRRWIKENTIEYIDTPSTILFEKEYIDNYTTTVYKKVKVNENTETK